MREAGYRECWPWLISLAVVVLWYPTLTWSLGFSPLGRSAFGLAFNSMAEHSWCWQGS